MKRESTCFFCQQIITNYLKETQFVPYLCPLVD